MSITLHWIHEWKMQSVLIALKYFPARHTSTATFEPHPWNVYTSQKSLYHCKTWTNA
jgi:hypothetical protein